MYICTYIHLDICVYMYICIHKLIPCGISHGENWGGRTRLNPIHPNHLHTVARARVPGPPIRNAVPVCVCVCLCVCVCVCVCACVTELQSAGPVRKFWKVSAPEYLLHQVSVYRTCKTRYLSRSIFDFKKSLLCDFFGKHVRTHVFGRHFVGANVLKIFKILIIELLSKLSLKTGFYSFVLFYTEFSRFFLFLWEQM
jgi:hypothetical protein